MSKGVRRKSVMKISEINLQKEAHIILGRKTSHSQIFKYTVVFNQVLQL